VAAGVNPSAAHLVANEPPIGSLFSAFLGENPIAELLGPTGALKHLAPSQAAYITGRSFFPKLIEAPFAAGLHLAFTFAAIATAIAVVASALRGRRYMHRPAAGAETLAEELAEGAAESAGIVGLDEAAAVAGLDEAAAVPGGNGSRAARRSGNGHNGVSAASASSGAETEFGSSSENI
jgi:membrane protein implicated in regulation of membrane protease activity